MNLQMRYTAPEDAEMLSHFAAKTFYDTYAWYNDANDMSEYINSNFSKAQTEAEIKDPQSAFLLVFMDDNLCGYAKFAWRNPPAETGITNAALEIARLYADKNCIGKGIGKIMIHECIAYAKKGDAAAIWLDVWKENKRAIRFYEKCGFTIICDWFFVLGKDKQHDFIMLKKI